MGSTGDADAPDDGAEAPRAEGPAAVALWLRPRVLAAVVAAGVLAVGAVGWVVVGRDDGDGPPPLPPAAVVAAYYQARHDGDCEGLVDLATESSWSADGDRSRDEFVALCEDALDGYRPPVQNVTISGPGDLGNLERIYEGGELPPDAEDWDLSVTVASQPEGVDCCPPGHVVAEDGRWKVELDGYVFSVGLRPDEAVEADLSAYNRLDDGLRPQLGATWHEIEIEPSQRDRLEHGYGEAEAEIEVEPVIPRIPGEHAVPGSEWSEVVRLVYDGLAWRTDGEVLPQAKAYVELRALVSPHVEVGGGRCYDHRDVRPRDWRERSVPVDSQPGYQQAITRVFGSCGTTVTLSRFTDAEAAEAAATALAGATPRSGEQHIARAHGDNVVHVANWSEREPELGLPGGDPATLESVLQAQLERL